MKIIVNNTKANILKYSNNLKLIKNNGSII